MQSFVQSQSAPATAAEFKRAITTGFRAANPGASIVFTGRVRRFGPREGQAAGTVSFLVEFLAYADGKAEFFLGDSYRSGNVNREGRVGWGHVSASPKGAREVWA